MSVVADIPENLRAYLYNFIRNNPNFFEKIHWIAFSKNIRGVTTQESLQDSLTTLRNIYITD